MPSSKGLYSTCDEAHVLSSMPQATDRGFPTPLSRTRNSTSETSQSSMAPLIPSNSNPGHEQQQHQQQQQHDSWERSDQCESTTSFSSFSNASFRRDSSTRDRPLPMVPSYPYPYDNIDSEGQVIDMEASPKYANDVKGGHNRPKAKPSHSSDSKPKMCASVILLSILISLITSLASIYLAISTYREFTLLSKMQSFESDSSGDSLDMTSAHVKLSANSSDFSLNGITEVSRTRLSIETSSKGQHHCQRLHCSSKHISVRHPGSYFVYSSINFNVNDIEDGCENELISHKTWLHHIILERNGGKSALLRTEQTCCTNCDEYRTSSFTGGIFNLKQGDKIWVIVSAPLIVINDKESSYLGLFMVDS